MISKLFKHKETTSKLQPTQSKLQPTQLWTEVNTNQQETMKGGYPWPGFPPTGGGGFGPGKGPKV